jgi:hypothetical protein
MLKKVYMVGQLRQKVDFVNLETKERGTFPLFWEPGQLGVFLVFGTKEAAEKYQAGAGFPYPVIEWDVEEPTLQ